MPNPIETRQSTVKTEVIHTPTHAIVLNAYYSDLEKQQELLAVVRDGLPDTWIDYVPFEGNLRHEGRWFKDDMDNPRFFAKKRTTLVQQDLGRFLRLSYHPSIVRPTQASTSLLNEFTMAQKVMGVLANKEVREIAQLYGFRDVRFIQPILGLIERTTKSKIMVYDFIQADNIFSSPLPGRVNRIEELRDQPTGNYHQNYAQWIADELRDIFGRHGIIANDIDDHQLLSSKDVGTGEFTLFLVDIDAYYMLPQQVR